MKKVTFVCSILIILSMLLAPTGTVLAQDQQPPKSPQPVERKGGSAGPYNRAPSISPETAPAGEMQAMAAELGLLQSKEGLWYNMGAPEADEINAQADISALATADSFGNSYKSVPYKWIDATGGTLLDDDTIQYVSLPFSFQYYGDYFDYIGIARAGYLQVGDYSWTRTQSPMLEASEPNSVIAPFWAPLYPYYDESGVYTLTGADDTGNYVVFEWYQMTDWYGDGYENIYTFEAILYEDGRIIFQYDDMSFGGWGWYCGAAGIEDWTGIIGRTTLKFCAFPKSYRGIQFAPPAKPAARIKVFPVQYGAFGAPGKEAEATFSVHNNGNLAEDVYDFTVKSKWPVTLYDWDTGEPLEDSDGDRKVDTGSLLIGETMNILARVLVPEGTLPGKTMPSTITVASSLKTSRRATVSIQTTVPVDFAQGYQRYWESQLGYVSSTAGVTIAEANIDGWYGTTPAVATTASGDIVSVWSDYYCGDESCPVEELYYKVNNKQGTLIRDNTKLQDLTALTNVWDFNGVVATAPDGSTGIAWVHEVYQYDEYERFDTYQYNIYFAILNANGELGYGPVDITQNAEYFSYQDYTGKRFYAPHIAATLDNRFVLTWRMNEYLDDYYQDGIEDNIFTTILDTSGTVVQGIIERTFDRHDANGDGYDDNAYYEPSVTQLTNNRFLLTWTGWDAKKWRRTYKVYYQVFNSDGSPANTVRTISTGAFSNYSLDAAQMSNGQIIVAWSHGTKSAWNSKASVYYMVLNDLTYKKTKGPVPLTHKAALTGSGYVSVTTDSLGHAVLTWVDQDQAYGKNLYYALLGKNGAVLTKPAIVQANFDRWDGPITVSMYGYGNTPSIP